MSWVECVYTVEEGSLGTIHACDEVFRHGLLDLGVGMGLADATGCIMITSRLLLERTLPE